MTYRHTTTILQTGAVFLAVAFTASTRADEIAAETRENSATASVKSVKAKNTEIEEVIVTAQKSSQTVNEVGMSISALSGTDLMDKQISDPSDLARVVPGFTAQPGPYNTPVYTLRGVGFYDRSLGASPSVSVYTDEVPLPYSAMTKGVAFDLERVEVLKGPQGTLFGQNSTGGAINYIAAKPTDTFTAGVDASYGRFNTTDVLGFISGPVADDLRMRFAMRTLQQADGWQKSYVSGDTLGKKNQVQARWLIDWVPTDKLSITVNLNGWTDRGDTQAGQLVAIEPSGTRPVPGVNVAPLWPVAPDNARAADWTPRSLERDDKFWQSAVGINYELTDSWTLTSITAYENYKTHSDQDNDGFALADFDVDILPSEIKDFSQELRLSGDFEKTSWITGVSYERATINQAQTANYQHATNNGTPFGTFYHSEEHDNQVAKTYAAFANVDYEMLDTVSLLAGVRYTQADRTFNGCQTAGGDANTAAVFTNIANFYRSLPVAFGGGGLAPDIAPLGVNDCSTISLTTFEPELFRGELDEHNVSWRAGVNWTVTDDNLLYLIVSKGYKAGGFPSIGSITDREYTPIEQESLIAYEAGIKSSLLDRSMQVNAAMFYYKYSDKQILGKTANPIFGLLDGLVNVPKSNIKGVEAQITWIPLSDLKLSLAGTYLDTEITEYEDIVVAAPFGAPPSAAVYRDYSGTRLPYTPNLSVVADASYRWEVKENLSAFAGVGLNYNSSTNARIGYLDNFDIPSYTTIDLRAGVASPDDHWRVTLWGRNVTDKYYWTNVQQSNDTIVRYAAMPATYGVSFNYRFD